MIIKLPLLNTGVTPFSGLSNLRGGQVAGKSKILATNLQASAGVVQSRVKESLMKAGSNIKKIDTMA